MNFKHKVWTWYLTIVGIGAACAIAAASGCASALNSPLDSQASETASDACANNLAKVQLVKDQAAKLGLEPLVLARRTCDTALLAIAVVGANVRDCPTSPTTTSPPPSDSSAAGSGG
jgi:hypothetical protein